MVGMMVVKCWWCGVVGDNDAGKSGGYDVDGDEVGGSGGSGGVGINGGGG